MLRLLPTFRLILQMALASAGGAFVLLGAGISVGELNYNDPEGTDFDFIELVNTGGGGIPLQGLTFTRGVGYTFAKDESLASGERIVVVRDRSKFLARYGNGIRMADGAFSGGFSADGERVTLMNAGGATVLDFTYGPSGDWPSRPNGLGSTLEPVDPSGNLNDPANWRASSEWLGSPGRAGVGPLSRVVINEVLAHTDPPFEDAIELLNLTGETLRLDGWYLSNERADPLKFAIPANTVLAPHGRVVIYEYQFSPANPASGQKVFRFNSAHGDEAVLLSTDSTGRPEYWMDTISFGATANGIPLGRYPEGTGPITTLERQTFGSAVTMALPEEFLTEFRRGKGAPNAGPLVGPVVVRRIQPISGNTADEFLELESIQATTVPLFDPSHPANTWKIRGDVEFDLPQGILLEPGQRILVVGIDPDLFRTRHSIPATTRVLGPWTGSLGDRSGRVVLEKPDPPQMPPHPDAGFVPYVQVEEIGYSVVAPWPGIPIGSGAALIRKDVRQFGDTPDNWGAESVLPPPPPVVTAGITSKGVVQLHFNAEVGRIYRLESRETAPSAEWIGLGVIPVRPGAGVVDLEPPMIAPARLLRVTVE